MKGVKENTRSRIHQNGLKTVIIKPRSGVSEGSVEGQQPVHPQFQLHDGLHAAAFSNESWDPSELKGEKILLSGLLVGFSMLA